MRQPCFARVATDRGRRLFLVDGSDRALLYGAARLSDLGLRLEGEDVVIETDGKVHGPALAIRGNYTLACWGKTHLWTRQNWCHVFDAMAADAMNVVLFWLSGLFPSQQHPASVFYPQTRISVEDLRAMILGPWDERRGVSRAAPAAVLWPASAGALGR